MRAIHRLTDNATSRFRFSKKAMGNLPEDQQYNVHALLEKARELIKHLAMNTVGAQNTEATANTLTMEHIVEHIVHKEQLEETNKRDHKRETGQTKQTHLD